jgi:ADP-ribose pyrophosphatase
VDLTEKQKSREVLAEGALLAVYRDTVALPNGGESVREWVRHPGAAAVVPLFEDGSTVLVRQFRYPPRREFLEVPAGKFDDDREAPEALARRELAEEVGYAAGRMTKLGVTYPCIGYSNEVIHLFLAEGLTASQGHADHGETLVPVRMPFAEAVALAERGEVLDTKSALALLLARAHVDRRGG